MGERREKERNRKKKNNSNNQFSNSVKTTTTTTTPCPRPCPWLRLRRHTGQSAGCKGLVLPATPAGLCRGATLELGMGRLPVAAALARWRA